MQKQYFSGRVLGAQVSLLAAASALTVNYPHYGIRTVINSANGFSQIGHRTLSGSKIFTLQHNFRSLQISEVCAIPRKTFDSLTGKIGIESSKKFYGADRYLAGVERESTNLKLLDSATVLHFAFARTEKKKKSVHVSNSLFSVCHVLSTAKICCGFLTRLRFLSSGLTRSVPN
jgi:hypothetical protein